MVIVDFVLVKSRKGRLGFLTNRGRINVSVTRSKYFQVLIGDSNCLDAPKAKASSGEGPDSKGKAPEPNTVDPDDEGIEETQLWESTTKPIKLLFDHYNEKGVVVDVNHVDRS